MIGMAGNRNTYEYADQRGLSVSSMEGVVSARPTYVCVKCQRTFKDYRGMKRMGSGLGYCPDHAPAPKPSGEAAPCETA